MSQGQLTNKIGASDPERPSVALLVRASGRESRLRWTLLCLILGHASLFFGLGLARHWGYLTALNDLGAFDQAVWGLLNGEPFLNTNNPFAAPMNWLGFHFHGVLLLFVPLYGLLPTPVWFALAQAMAVSFTAWPIFLLACRVSGSSTAGFLWAVVYLANPFLLNGAAWDFHPVSLALPCIALAMLGIEKNNPGLACGACLALLPIQEHLGLMVTGFGFLWWLRNRSPGTALTLLVLGFGHAGLVLGFLMPHFSPTQGLPMLSDGLGGFSRYGWLGGSPGQILLTVLQHPLWLLETVFLDMGGGAYLFLLLLPFIFLPLVALPFLLPGIADLAANLLSSNPMPRAWLAYHSITLVPILTVAAIYGVRRVVGWQQRWHSQELAGVVCLVSLILGYLLAPLPLPGAADAWAARRLPGRPDSSLEAVRAVIPVQASLSVQANVGPHFSQRSRIYPFPVHVPGVDAVILRLNTPTSRLGTGNPAEIGTLAHHLQIAPEAFLDQVSRLLDSDYGVLLWQDSWLVLERGRKTEPAVAAAIRTRIEDLRHRWLSPADGKAG